MRLRRFSLRRVRLLRREAWIAIGPALLVTIAAFVVTSRYIKPAPPKSITLAVGRDEGGAKHYAKRYREQLEKHGVAVEVRETEGSAANLALLRGDEPEADIAVVQSGTAEPEEGGDVESLASVAYMPLWVLYRGDEVVDPASLRGRRIAIGAPGSGTQIVARKILAAVGADVAPTVLLDLDRDQAFEALKAGTVDAVFVVAPAESRAVQRAAAVPGVRTLSFDRAEAFARRFPFLRTRLLPKGVFDLAANVPPHDVKVVAATGDLVASRTLHPALAYLLMRAATEIHGRAGMLDDVNEFPTPVVGGFPLSDEARRYFRSGTPFLQRYLPFWAANLVDRLWVMLLPVVALVFPMLKLVPPLYRWRVRSRVYRWYARLKEVEIALDESPGREELERMMQTLEEVERAVNRIPTPLSHAEHLYFFREHIELVRRRIERRLATTAPAPTEVAA